MTDSTSTVRLPSMQEVSLAGEGRFATRALLSENTKQIVFENIPATDYPDLILVSNPDDCLKAL